MKKKRDDRPEVPLVIICQGRQEKATYRDPRIEGYRGNPFIEALPLILTEDEALESLAYYPSYSEEERNVPSHLRLHMIQLALDFFAPLPIHLDLEQRISRLIRAGYKVRNPLMLGFWQAQEEKIRSINQLGNNRRFCRRSMAAGFTIIGFPGVGKTSAVEEILQLYPQVIYHSHYQGRDFTRAQIVWLKIECPHDGSTKGLCVNFFQAIDSLIGSNYQENFAAGRRTLDEMMPDMARMASIHGIGVLVIDDIQFLSQANSGGSSRMLNFFTYLASTVGVPVILIATYKARRVLTGEFSLVRRGTGQGDLVWDKMEEGEWQERKTEEEEGHEESNVQETERAETPSVWQVFLESLWLYQYTKTPCPLTRELSHVLYEETQGITDFTVKVYMLAQIRAITTDETGEERLTEEIIWSVAQDSLKTAQRVLNALRLGDMEGLEKLRIFTPSTSNPSCKKPTGSYSTSKSSALWWQTAAARMKRWTRPMRALKSRVRRVKAQRHLPSLRGGRGQKRTGTQFTPMVTYVRFYRPMLKQAQTFTTNFVRTATSSRGPNTLER
jgi:hypothetical protein